MDDVNIYEDLDAFDLGLSINKFEKDNAELTKKVEEQEKIIEKMVLDVSELQITNKNLQVNISELYKTAKAEISRKDRQIADLRREMDDIVFQKGNRNSNGFAGKQNLLNQIETFKHEVKEKNRIIYLLNKQLEENKEKEKEVAASRKRHLDLELNDHNDSNYKRQKTKDYRERSSDHDRKYRASSRSRSSNRPRDNYRSDSRYEEKRDYKNDRFKKNPYKSVHKSRFDSSRSPSYNSEYENRRRRSKSPYYDHKKPRNYQKSRETTKSRTSSCRSPIEIRGPKTPPYNYANSIDDHGPKTPPELVDLYNELSENKNRPKSPIHIVETKKDSSNVKSLVETREETTHLNDFQKSKLAQEINLTSPPKDPRPYKYKDKIKTDFIRLNFSKYGSSPHKIHHHTTSDIIEISDHTSYQNKPPLHIIEIPDYKSKVRDVIEISDYSSADPNEKDRIADYNSNLKLNDVIDISDHNDVFSDIEDGEINFDSDVSLSPTEILRNKEKERLNDHILKLQEAIEISRNDLVKKHKVKASRHKEKVEKPPISGHIKNIIKQTDGSEDITDQENEKDQLKEPTKIDSLPGSKEPSEHLSSLTSKCEKSSSQLKEEKTTQSTQEKKKTTSRRRVIKIDSVIQKQKEILKTDKDKNKQNTPDLDTTKNPVVVIQNNNIEKSQVKVEKSNKIELEPNKKNSIKQNEDSKIEQVKRNHKETIVNSKPYKISTEELLRDLETDDSSEDDKVEPQNKESSKQETKSLSDLIKKDKTRVETPKEDLAVKTEEIENDEDLKEKTQSAIEKSPNIRKRATLFIEMNKSEDTIKNVEDRIMKMFNKDSEQSTNTVSFERSQKKTKVKADDTKIPSDGTQKEQVVSKNLVEPENNTKKVVSTKKNNVVDPMKIVEDRIMKMHKEDSKKQENNKPEKINDTILNKNIKEIVTIEDILGHLHQTEPKLENKALSIPPQALPELILENKTMDSGVLLHIPENSSNKTVENILTEEMSVLNYTTETNTSSEQNETTPKTSKENQTNVISSTESNPRKKLTTRRRRAFISIK